MNQYIHIPIMLNECIEALQIRENGIYVDCTTNRGGHSLEIIKRLNSQGTLICIDLDSVALAEAQNRFEDYYVNNAIASANRANIIFVNENYRYIKNILQSHNISEVDGVLADLGISSEELDISGRGFSFMRDEPLLMTFKDNSAIDDDTLTAEYVVNNWSEETLATILWAYADEQYRGRIARAICEAREREHISTTTQLVNIIRNVLPQAYVKKRGSHFATRTFQALRMVVNDELGGVKDLIHDCKGLLSKGGRMAIITFHSTEDRIVKLAIKENNYILINKKPITPSEEETKQNPRSRSAKLRIISN